MTDADADAIRRLADIQAAREKIAAAAVARFTDDGDVDLHPGVQGLVDQLATTAAMTAVHRGDRPDGYLHTSLEALVLAEGDAWDRTQVYVDPDATGTPKNCFGDALHYVLDNACSYVEGYAIGAAGIAVHHAWAVNDDDEVIDPTWQAVAAEHGDGTFPVERSAYIGVGFDAWYVARMVQEKGTYCVFDWEHDLGAALKGGVEALPDYL